MHLKIPHGDFPAYICLRTTSRNSALVGFGRVQSSVFRKCPCVLLMGGQGGGTLWEIFGELGGW